MDSKKVEVIAKRVKALPESDQKIVEGIVSVLNDSDRGQTIDNIRELDLAIFTNKGRIKALNERALEIIEGHNAYNEMVDAERVYKTAKEKLRIALLSDGDYNDVMENIADEKLTLKDQKDMLSLHVVEYYTTTHERQVEIDDSGDARELVVTGKLGARGKYQTNLFGKSEESRRNAEDQQQII